MPARRSFAAMPRVPRHDLHVPIIERLRSRATSERPRVPRVHVRRICGGSAGVRGGSSPDAGRLREPRGSPRWGLAAALVALWLLVDPRTPDLAAQVYRARPVRTRRVRRVGRALVRGPRAARLQPAVSAARLAARAARRWRRCRCWSRRRCSSGWCSACTARLRALGRRLVRGRGRRRHLGSGG